MGMVGGGQGAFIGSVHRMAAALDGQIDLVCGAFSRDPDNCIATGNQLALEPDRIYQRYSDMFAREAERIDGSAIQCVSIVTPNHMHVPIAKAAIRAGFHVICDKPAGISLAEVRELASMIDKSNAIYALTHTYLGYPMVWQARHIAQSPRFGAIRKVLVEYPQGWLAGQAELDGSKQAEWRTDPAKSGPSGAMGDIGSHAHSLVEFVTSARMDRLSARLRTHFNDRLLDDDGEISFSLDNGATGVLLASQVCTGEENALKIRVYGENGSLTWHQMEPNTLLEGRAEGTIHVHRSGVDKPLCPEALERCRLPSGHPEGYIEAFANLYREFAGLMRNPRLAETSLLPGIGEALRGMAFLEAAVASHANGSAWTDVQNFPDHSGYLEQGA